eukprot:SM000060S19622  [mRNA]  locus=s60:200030:201011:+ [translate_table: standard]
MPHATTVTGWALLYVHAGFDWRENHPGTLFLRRLWEALPPEGRRSLGASYVLHPGIGLHIALWAACAGLSDRPYQKVEYVHRVEFLWEHIEPDQVELPEHALEHDGELEGRPLMDYMFEVDPVLAMQHLSFPSDTAAAQLPTAAAHDFRT